MSASGGFGIPGHGALVETSEREILWGRDDQHLQTLWKGYPVSSAARDAGNTPTTVLRRGLLMGVLTSSGELEEWDADASDGTQNIAAVLNNELNILDLSGTAVDRVPMAPLISAPVIAGRLLIQGDAFVGHADEYLARRVMHQMGFRFDDDPHGYYAGAIPRTIRVTGTTDTLTPQENGALLIYSNAASVTVTLPAIQPGLVYDILREGDEELIVVSTEGDNVIVGNDLSADGVTFTTAGEHIGAQVRVESIYVNTTLKWRLTLPYVPFNTGLNTLTFAINT